MSQVAWIDNDELFRSELQEGKHHEALFAKRLAESGLYVRLARREFRKDKNDIERFSRDKDIVVGKSKTRWLEIKATRTPFDSLEDYPYPNAFVCGVYGWSKLDPKDLPLAVVVVSREGSGVIVIPSSSFPHWTTKTYYDRIKKQDDTQYQCHRRYWHDYDALVKVLKGRTNG